MNGAGAQKTNPIGFLSPATVFDGPARPSRHGASSAPSRRADCRKRVLPGRFRPARPGPSQWFTVECQSRPRPSHPASCDRPTWGPPGSYFGKRGAGVALPAGSNGPGRPARAPLPAIARFEQLARRAADPQMLEHSNLRLTRATCVGCHHPPLGAGTPRQLLGGRPYRQRRHGLKHATRLAGALVCRLAPPLLTASRRASCVVVRTGIGADDTNPLASAP